MRASRRTFFGLLTGAAAGAALSRTPLGQALRSPAAEPAPRSRGEESWVTTTCALCPAACGVRARIVDGRVVKLEGNPKHPVNRGGLCALGQAGTHVLYHPDRIIAPRARDGGRRGPWRDIGWAEALGLLSRRLAALREKGAPNHLVVLDGSAPGVTQKLVARFASAYGTSHHVRDIVPDAMEAAVEWSQGIAARPAYDIENAALVLSFGSPLLESWSSPVQAHRAYAVGRCDRSPRGRWIQLDTRFSHTAAKADRFIPVRPGGHGALALALAYVLVREDLYDKEFVRKHTAGFDDAAGADGATRVGFKNFLLRSCRPDALSSECGVPVDQILRLAKEFAATRPAVALADHGATLHRNGVFTAFAVHALNALVGSLDSPGGVLTPYPVPWGKWPDVALDAAATAGLEARRVDGAGRKFPFARDAMANVPDGLRDARTEVVLLVRSNPLASSPDPERFARALEGVPFVAAIASHADEAVECADLVLPEPTYLERFDAVEGPHSLAVPVVSLEQPAAPPPSGVRPAGGTLIELARALGSPVSDAFPWKSHEEAVRDATRGLFECRRGTVLVDARTETQVRELERRGWWEPAFASYAEFESALRTEGAWWEPTYFHGEWGRILRTPSGRFEFRSSRLEETIDRLYKEGGRGAGREDVVASLGIHVSAEEAALPHYEAPVFSNPAEPDRLHLEPFLPLTLGAAWIAGLPWLQDVLEPYGQSAWDSWIELNPVDAARLGIRHFDRVRVVGPSGEGVFTALVLPTAAPGLAAVPMGYGRRAGTSGAAQRGESPLRLLEPRLESLTGIPCRLATRVRIEPLGAPREPSHA